MVILQMTSATDFRIRGHTAWGLGSYSFLHLSPVPPRFLGQLLLLFSVPSRSPPASWIERLSHASSLRCGKVHTRLCYHTLNLRSGDSLPV